MRGNNCVSNTENVDEDGSAPSIVETASLESPPPETTLRRSDDISRDKMGFEVFVAITRLSSNLKKE
jgi:hypothetical protein